MPEFVPLHVALRPRAESVPVSTSSPPPDAPPTPCESERETAMLIGEIRRFRAAVADAFEHEVDGLLRNVACSVLARELQSKPADLEAIVARARSKYARERIVALRVHPADVDELANLDADVLPDGALRRGDVVLELQSGTIDLTLGVRLEAVLSREPA